MWLIMWPGCFNIKWQVHTDQSILSTCVSLWLCLHTILKQIEKSVNIIHNRSLHQDTHTDFALISRFMDCSPLSITMTRATSALSYNVLLPQYILLKKKKPKDRLVSVNFYTLKAKYYWLKNHPNLSMFLLYIFMPPFEEEGHIALHLSVGRSVGRYVGR
jgi:hypothetical protein